MEWTATTGELFDVMLYGDLISAQNTHRHTPTYTHTDTRRETHSHTLPYPLMLSKTFDMRWKSRVGVGKNATLPVRHLMQVSNG